MEITPEQFAQVEHCLPTQRGNVSLSNLQVVNAILYVAEHGCKWRGLPKRFGNWHTIYTRMNRWTKAGVLDRMFEELQRAQVVRIRIEAVSLDSTSIKVHPDGTGALKKRPASHRQVPRRMEHQGSYGCRGCSNGHNVLSVALPGARRTRRPRATVASGRAEPTAAPDHGSSLRRQRDTTTRARSRLHSRRASSGHSGRAVGLRPSDVQASQRGRAAVSSPQGLPPNLLPLREARCHVPRLHQLR